MSLARWFRDWWPVLALLAFTLAVQALAIAKCGYGWEGFGR